MPTLKQLTCHVEWAPTNIPFKEYGVSYGDGVVETYIAVPSVSTPFSINLKSSGYIAPGLAMFVFIDGVYQCNRNRDNIVVDEASSTAKEKSTRKGVEFRVRQKEELRADGRCAGRPWRFEPLQIIPTVPGMPEIGPKSHFDHLGDITVVVLRCKPRNGQPANVSDGSRTPDSAMAPSLDFKDIAAALSDEEFEIAKAKYNKMEPSLRPETKPEPVNLLGDFGMLFDGANDRYYVPTRSRHGGHHGHQGSTGIRRRHRHEEDSEYGTDYDCSHHGRRNIEHPAGHRTSSRARTNRQHHEMGFNTDQSEINMGCSACAGQEAATARQGSQEWYHGNQYKRHHQEHRGRSNSHSSERHHYQHENKPTTERQRYRYYYRVKPQSCDAISDFDKEEHECSCPECSPQNIDRPAAHGASIGTNCGQGYCQNHDVSGVQTQYQSCQHTHTPRPSISFSNHSGKPSADPHHLSDGRISAKRNAVHAVGHGNLSNDAQKEQTLDVWGRKSSGEKIIYGTTQTSHQGVPSIVLNVNTPQCGGGEHSSCKVCSTGSNDSDTADNGCYLISNGKKVPHHCRGPRTRAPYCQSQTGDQNHHSKREASKNGEHNNCCGNSNNHSTNSIRHRSGSGGTKYGHTEPRWDGLNRSRGGSASGINPDGDWNQDDPDNSNWENNDNSQSTSRSQDNWTETRNNGETGVTNEPNWNSNEAENVNSNNNDWQQEDWGNENDTNTHRWDSINVKDTNNETNQNDSMQNNNNNTGSSWETDNENSKSETQQHDWGNVNSNDNCGTGDQNNQDNQWRSGNSIDESKSIENANGDTNAQPESQAVPISAFQQPYWVPLQHFQVVTPAQQPTFVSQAYLDPQNAEPALYTVPESVVKEKSLSHQVQVGRAEGYLHKMRAPWYLDTMEEPYAKFVFKYRMEETIEQKFNVKIEQDLDVIRKKLEMLPKSEIVDQLLHVQTGQTRVSPAVTTLPEPAGSGTTHYGSVLGNSGNLHTYPPMTHLASPPPSQVSTTAGVSMPTESPNIDGANGNTSTTQLPLHGVLIYGRAPPSSNVVQVVPVKTKTTNGGNGQSKQTKNAKSETSNGGNGSSQHNTGASGDPFRRKHSQENSRSVEDPPRGAGDPFRSRNSGNSQNNNSARNDENRIERQNSGSRPGGGDPFRSQHSGNGGSGDQSSSRSHWNAAQSTNVSARKQSTPNWKDRETAGVDCIPTPGHQSLRDNASTSAAEKRCKLVLGTSFISTSIYTTLHLNIPAPYAFLISSGLTHAESIQLPQLIISMDSSNAPPTQKSTLEPGALYVQKLPSGRPAFVRKPVKIASAKDLIAKALLHSGTMSHLLSRPGKYYPFPVPEADRFNVVSPSTIPSTSFHERGFPNHALSTESRHRCGEQHINRMVYMPPQPANFIGSHTHLPSQFDRDTGNFRPSGSGERRNDEEYRSRDRQRRPYDDNSPCCHERHLRHSHSRNPRVHFTDDDESDPRYETHSSQL
ncbi:hypothetical protein LOZ61_000652 [Ophidiomyces ophidiicola]|uniref:uncharacterized protein n=1 Tax=Ophidiomyces ophidiicola TaxID=1387563 RepID=UPI0020C2273D|nr:uncharacterized protein LOZ57_003708 [Ophidiomyces ophidiicola]KAI1917135.1 hypothetical protein LOZ61_000652 [Ophidiomyces ophidiicola]KAI1946453.1 hypothetical protein LOZ57_003708 [Ophidiomyces ophidiicola]KAI1966138.1 hypothetical protein LOZ56_005911 [Ophidiomyces ophidiicola]KAI2010289.1 hypothetical protein LOZ50_001128 [Ophidiomyces ophidiicola]KAI2015399.1 hypothetical protein LOZ49_000630 [Ophidiomyces ophidiicola]